MNPWAHLFNKPVIMSNLAYKSESNPSWPLCLWMRFHAFVSGGEDQNGKTYQHERAGQASAIITFSHATWLGFPGFPLITTSGGPRDHERNPDERGREYHPSRGTNHEHTSLSLPRLLSSISGNPSLVVGHVMSLIGRTMIKNQSNSSS